MRCLVGLDDARRDAAAVADGVTVLARPVPDGAGLLAVAAGVMLAVAALAALVPARRAGAVDPIVVLRTD